MTKVIPLTQGLYTLVDDAVFTWASKFTWHASKQRDSFYASRKEWDGQRDHPVSLHRDIMGRPSGLEVDHINGDTLDNRKENLREVTVSQNQHNRRRASKNSRTGVRGVSWHDRDKCFRVGIQIRRQRIDIGGFQSIEDAERTIVFVRAQLAPDGLPR